MFIIYHLHCEIWMIVREEERRLLALTMMLLKDVDNSWKDKVRNDKFWRDLIIQEESCVKEEKKYFAWSLDITHWPLYF